MSTVTLTTGTWTLDAKHTRVGFTAKNFVVKSVVGTFDLIAGTVDLADDVAATTVHLSLDAASFDTENPKRDDHVRGDDFLNAAEYPTIDFTSDRVTLTASGTYEIVGKLVVAGRVSEAVFHIDTLDAHGKDASFTASGELDRREIGIDKMPSLMIGNTITLQVSGMATLA